MEQRKVLITGCSGYLGADMSAHFIDNGWQVFGIDPAKPPVGLELTDFRQTTVAAVIDRPWDVDVVIHLGGLTKLGFDRELYWLHNVESTKRLKRLYPNTPLLYASTCAMYNEHGKPEVDHPYPQSKREGEQYADIAFRMGSVTGANRFGKYLRVPDLMIAGALEKKAIRVINPNTQRALAGIKWICEQYLNHAANPGFAGMKVLVQAQTSMRDLGQMVKDVIGDAEVEISTVYEEASDAFLTGSNIVPNVVTGENSLRELVCDAVIRYKEHYG